MSVENLFFAGGGTGGHIYPSLAVAEAVREIAPQTRITFLCSRREIDARILSKYDFEFIPIPAVGLSLRPDRLMRFFALYVQSKEFVSHILRPVSGNSAVVGCGGFVSAPVITAAKKYSIPSYLINVDFVPGLANKFAARHARRIFLQFAGSADYFKAHRERTVVSGCPLRKGFDVCDKQALAAELGISPDKKLLVVTGASSGAVTINNAFVSILPSLSCAQDWQIVHLTGSGNLEKVAGSYSGVKIEHKVLEYYHDMPALLACADLVIGRGGALSVAEYAASGTASIILPYPYHKDEHQRLNAEPLRKTAAAVVVDDLPDNPKETAKQLSRALMDLLCDDNKRTHMAKAAGSLAKPNAAKDIAQLIVKTST